MNALLSFAPLLAQHKGRLARALVLGLVTIAAGIALLGLSGWFLTAAALTTAGALFNLFAPSAGVRGLSFLRILSRYGEKLAGHDATLRLLSDLRRWLFGRLFPLLPLRRQGHDRADLVSRLVADIDALDTAFLVALGPITNALLVGLAMTLGLVALLPSAALPYGAAAFATAILVPVGLIRASRAAARDAARASALLRNAVLDGLDRHQDLVVFDGLDRARLRATRAAEALARARRRLSLHGAIASALLGALAGLAMLGTLLAGLSALADGLLDGPVLAALLLAVIASFEAYAPLVRSATRLAAAAASAERLRALADLEPAIAEPAVPAPLPSDMTLAFNAVAFGHDPRRPVLHDLSFTLAPGSCTAITGPSGAGKSSIAQLLVRLAEPQSGTITLGGTDIATLRLADLRETIGLMTQDAPVFLDTIADNLRLGRPDADDTALWRVLADVGLADFVAGLPDGLSTLVGEAGQTLSAGQVRRLALARTLLSPARILVLDEPTSGLDAEAEAAFLADLPALANGRTIVVITHAALPVQGFDAVLRLRAGRLLPTASRAPHNPFSEA
ncbi:thiol reductant ABC exporter subunit CydC [Arsenicitalea aurantiaca]|uniref:Thiol reductant ABC exporter subunit CydC n=1 Tax=Arsenicitalea aurantiaca TaxID=1783274 RepID=A0A433XLU0_9HYPH|nr:thiol reductant ABC exporter subunit CydC [Arsenicitalea aurantiaca]RUT35057.1 thiol reductant ABC exporter subunit CydC [Arsenicitalea aurantiaca]